MKPITETGELMIYPGKGGWHFLAFGEKCFTKIQDTVKSKRGFGAIRVQVTIGNTTWQTSIFPDKKRELFLLFVKKSVRQKEGLFEHDMVKYTVEVLN